MNDFVIHVVASITNQSQGGNHDRESTPGRDNHGPRTTGKIELRPLDAATARTYTHSTVRRKVFMTSSLIQSDPNVMTGKPVVRGTRITVETILRKLSCGESIDQLLESHPRLTREAVLAALEYAAEAMAHETVHAVAEPDSA